MARTRQISAPAPSADQAKRRRSAGRGPCPPFWRDTRGGSMVEFAVLIPILVLLGIGAFEFGVVALYKTAATSAARAGVQYGSLDFATAANTSAMEQAARDDLAGLGGVWNVQAPPAYCYCPTDGNVVCTATCSDGTFNMMYVEVTVEGEYEFILNYPGVTSPFPVSATARMRVR